MGESFVRDLSLVLLLMDPGWSDACEQSTDPESHVYHPWLQGHQKGVCCFCSIQPSVATVSVLEDESASPKACWSSFKVDLRIGLAA